MEDRRRTVVVGAAILRDAGLPFPGLIVCDANHEHGIIAVRPRSSDTLPDLAIDDRVRILPTHACANGGHHRSFHVVCDTVSTIEPEWPQFGGWWEPTPLLIFIYPDRTS